MRSILPLCFLSLFCFISCQKEIYFPEKERSTELILRMDDKTYPLQLSKQDLLNSSDTAILNIRASAGGYEISLQAISPKHKSGVGTYFLWCCGNTLLDKNTNEEYHALKQTNTLGSFGLQKGSCNITRSDAKGYEGSFVFEGRNKYGYEKTFSGEFVVIY